MSKLAQNNPQKGLRVDTDPAMQESGTYPYANNIDIGEIGAKLAAVNVKGSNLAVNVTDTESTNNAIGVLGAYRTSADIDRGNGFEQREGIIIFVKGSTPPPPAQALQPIVSPDAGIYSGFVAVTVTNQRAGETIYYTTDGSVPTEASTIYGGIVVVSTSTTLRFRAFSPIVGVAPSEVTTVAYVISALTVTISPAAGTYLSSRVVTLGSSSEDAVIYYTLDGSTPDDTSTQYTSPFTLTESATVKAIAIITGISTSAIAESAFGIQLIAPELTASGTNINDFEWTASNPNSVGDIRYTVDGSTPNGSSPIYSVPITVTATTNVKAAVFNATNVTSAVTDRTYTVQCADAEITPTDTSVPLGQLITLTSITPAVSIYYTTDGSTPTISSTLYSAPFSPTGTLFTVKALVTKSGLVDSAVSERTYSRIFDQPFTVSGIGASRISYDFGLTFVSTGLVSSYAVSMVNEGEIMYQLFSDTVNRTNNYGQTWASATNRPAGGSTQWNANGAPLTSKDGSLSIYTALSSPINQGIWISNDMFVADKNQIFPNGSVDTDFQPEFGVISEFGDYAIVPRNTATVYRTADGGATWSAIVLTGRNQTIGFAASLDMQFIYYVTNAKALLKSSDYGATYSAVSGAPLFNRIFSAQDGLILYGVNTTVTGGGTVGTWRSTDGGTSWTQIQTFAIERIDPTGQYVGYIVNSPLPRLVYISNDFGDTFAPAATFSTSGALGRLNMGYRPL